MKKLAIFLIILPFLVSCLKDSGDAGTFVEPFELNLSYKEVGKSLQFSSPLTVRFNNVTEQMSVSMQTDLNGHILVSGLLPGEYTVSVSGKLSAELVTEITGTATDKEYSLGGYLSSLKLKYPTAPKISIELNAQAPSSLLFKELYYCGSRTATQGTYRNDGFFSIYNNSDESVSLKDVYIANVENFGGLGTAGPLWTDETPGEYANVYAQAVWKIVAGNEDVMVAPGQTIVIATMAAPHNTDPKLNPTSPVDLSKADYEAYVVDPTNTYTNYPAPDMKMVFWPSYSFLWRISVFGQGMVLVKATPSEFESFKTVTLPQEFQDGFEDEEYWLCKQIPNSYVIDAVDLVQNESTTNTKRFNNILDSGAATVSGTYSSKSVIRKVAIVIDGREVLQDTNNSTEDFEVNDHPLSR